MTDFRFDRFAFETDHVNTWRHTDPINDDWPVVYIINNKDEIYIGETVNAATRMLQHLSTPGREHLEHVQIILNKKFNKSVCLDLESHLIRYFAADEKYKVLNGNWGISESNYYQRNEYRRDFDALFEELHRQGFLTRPIPELINSNLFKYSPFKALNTDQSVALSGILEALLGDLDRQNSSELVIQGDPGTGKTIVAIYLVKLLRDIALNKSDEIVGEDSIFAEYFTDRNKQHLNNFRIGLVIPQQSLRKTVEKVFARTPGLTKDMVLSPFKVGLDPEGWDVLIVDEAHRLGIRAGQSAGMQNKQLPEINRKLFGEDKLEITQLDWMRKQSKHRILLVDSAQSIRPADLPLETVEKITTAANNRKQLFRLTSQMRVNGGQDYIVFVNKLLSNNPEKSKGFGNYDLRFFESFTDMYQQIQIRNNEHELGRLLAGYAWRWNSKKDPAAHDIEIEGKKLFWNRTDTDWINSKTSAEEVGSIHTIQGYDLNYAGVIIGSDLGFDPIEKKITFDRENYFDTKGKENNRQLGITYSDEDIRQYVLNIYRVLLTRGIKGTYVYVHDDQLRQHLSQFF